MAGKTSLLDNRSDLAIFRPVFLKELPIQPSLTPQLLFVNAPVGGRRLEYRTHAGRQAPHVIDNPESLERKKSSAATGRFLLKASDHRTLKRIRHHPCPGGRTQKGAA